MSKHKPAFKVPDVKEDRKQIVKEAKKDLKDLLEEPGAIGNMADLAEALEKAKKRGKKR